MSGKGVDGCRRFEGVDGCAGNSDAAAGLDDGETPGLDPVLYGADRDAKFLRGLDFGEDFGFGGGVRCAHDGTNLAAF